MEETYNKLIQETLRKKPKEEILNMVATLTDISKVLGKEEGLKISLQWGKQFLNRKDLSSADKINMHYFLSISYADLFILKGNVWSWDNLEMEKEIFHLRSAIQNKDFKSIDKASQSAIFTNLANILNTVGRPIEAIKYWNKALECDENFLMAKGNKGICLRHYASSLFDSGHAFIFIKEAFHLLEGSVKLIENSIKTPEIEYAEPDFKENLLAIKDTFLKDELEKKINFDNHSLGNSKEEKMYRKWVLRHRLFLNPLNDITSKNIASRDILSLPNMVFPIEEIQPPILIKLYNQIKQEFVSARYLFYESITNTTPHFSDRETYIIDTLDYPSSSLSAEKAKIAYTHIYSIFDKIAQFINKYFELGIPPKDVSFRRIWEIKDEKGKKSLHPNIKQSENWILRGLYWLSKDFFEDSHLEVIDPEAKEIVNIRNYMEHRSFSVHELFFTEAEQTDLTLFVARDDFEMKTIKLFQLAREALIYTSLLTHQEEIKIKRKQNRPEKTIVPNPPSFIWSDEFKV